MEEQKPQEPVSPPPELYRPKPQEDQKRKGIATAQYNEFLTLGFLALERMSQRQRTAFRRELKAAAQVLNRRWPDGKPLEVIQREAQAFASKQIILPEGINPDSLKEKK